MWSRNKKFPFNFQLICDNTSVPDIVTLQQDAKGPSILCARARMSARIFYEI